jgi:hypothetical protein
MNTPSLFRNAFVALSLSAFLISPAHAGASDQDCETLPSTLALVSKTASFGTTGASAKDDDGSYASSRKVQQPSEASTPQADANISIVLSTEMLQHLYDNFLSIDDTVEAKKTCKALYETFSASRYTRWLDVAKFLRHPEILPLSTPFATTMLSGPIAQVRLNPALFQENSTLDLSHYRISLPTGALDALGGSLQTLFAHGRTDIFSGEAFSSLRNLQLLAVGGEALILSANLLSGLRGLQTLILRDYRKVLPARAFEDLGGSLQNLHLTEYTFPLSGRLLDGLVNLRHLTIERESGALPPELFSDLINLETLSILDHKSPFPPGIFAPLVNLWHLNIFGHTENIPEGIFAPLVSLTNLALRECADVPPEAALEALRDLGVNVDL